MRTRGKDSREGGGNDDARATLTRWDIDNMSSKELKRALNARGIKWGHCVEKAEFRSLLYATLPTSVEDID